MADHHTYQGAPHPCCRCGACNYWYPITFATNARITTLEAALKPFAEWAAEWDIRQADGKADVFNTPIGIGDLRRAAEVLEATTKSASIDIPLVVETTKCGVEHPAAETPCNRTAGHEGEHSAVLRTIEWGAAEVLKETDND